MSVNKSEIRQRRTSKVGKFDANLGYVPPKNVDGYKGRSQKGCFGNHVNSLNNKKEK